MTFTEMLFSFPGVIAMTFIVPAALALTIDWIAFVFDTVRDSKEPQAQPAPKGQNVIDFDTMAAISHIRNHEAMQFVSKN